MVVMIVNFIKTFMACFGLKFEMYLKKVPAMTNNTLMLTQILSYSIIYYLYKSSYKRTCM